MTKQEFINSQLFKFTGCGCQKECPTTKSEDNLYLIGLNYRGLYQDDDCTFYYVNAETGEHISHVWTTAGACPGFQSYLRATVKTAVENGWLSQEWLDNYIESAWINHKTGFIKELTSSIIKLSERVISKGKTLSIPCTVSNSCRKYKGDGILIRIVRIRNPYAYGENYDLKAKVLGIDGKIYTVSASSVTIDMDAVMGRMNDMVSTIKNTCEFYDIFPMVNLECELAVAVDVDHAAQMEKWYSRKAEKFPGLLEWCKNTKPELDSIALREWAEKIYRKNNPLPEWE